MTDMTKMGDRPSVNVTNASIAAEWLRNELGQRELSGLFRRENMIVHAPRIGDDGYIPAEKLGMVDAGPAQVRPISHMQVKAVIDARYLVFRTVTSGKDDKKVEEDVPCLFPPSSCQTAYDAAALGEGCHSVRILNGVTHTPTIRPDGSILNTPGYDLETGLLYLPDEGLDVVDVPDNPTDADISAARELILKPIAEFPFVTPDDKATWIGLAMTPALRQLFPPPYQMGIITATNPGSGKTLLTKLLTIVHGGVQRGEMPRDDAELRKSITAALIDTTAPIVVFDNLADVVRSAVLESLLTAKTHTDRILGVSKSVTVKNDRLWLATGNNAQFAGDLSRRTAMVHLDPPTANHWQRTDFEIEDLEAWMYGHRGKYLAAILTIARGWANAGCPAKRSRSDDYTAWTKGLQGMLDWAGFTGTFGGDPAAVTLSSDDQEWYTFLVELHRVFGDDPFQTKDIVKHLQGMEFHATNPGQPSHLVIDVESLPGDLATIWSREQSAIRPGGFAKSLGRWLTNREGRYAAEWQLKQVGRDGHSRKPLYVVNPTKD